MPRSQHHDDVRRCGLVQLETRPAVVAPAGKIDDFGALGCRPGGLDRLHDVEPERQHVCKHVKSVFPDFSQTYNKSRLASHARTKSRLPTALLPKGLIRPVSAIGKRYVMAAGMRFQYQTIAV